MKKTIGYNNGIIQHLNILTSEKTFEYDNGGKAIKKTIIIPHRQIHTGEKLCEYNGMKKPVRNPQF